MKFMKNIYNISKSILFFGILITSLTACDNKENSSSKTPEKSVSHTCPHCSGSGSRTNNITGKFGKCSSCGGDGNVTEKEYNRLSH